jgi:F0F1-type ATP synthase membrane subunit c/vacuolar-type H+-ATPase subunit K
MMTYAHMELMECMTGWEKGAVATGAKAALALALGGGVRGVAEGEGASATISSLARTGEMKAPAAKLK